MKLDYFPLFLDDFNANNMWNKEKIFTTSILLKYCVCMCISTDYYFIIYFKIGILLVIHLTTLDTFTRIQSPFLLY